MAVSDEENETVWMRCPYDADLCGADAVLTDVFISDGTDVDASGLVSDDCWAGTLTCHNGHVFRLSQQAMAE